MLSTHPKQTLCLDLLKQILYSKGNLYIIEKKKNSYNAQSIFYICNCDYHYLKDSFQNLIQQVFYSTF